MKIIIVHNTDIIMDHSICKGYTQSEYFVLFTLCRLRKVAHASLLSTALITSSGLTCMRTSL